MERRTPLVRKAPLKQAAPLKRGGPVPAGRRRLQPRSAKMRRTYEQPGGRRDVVREVIEDAGGRCQIGWDERCRGYAESAHELLSRAQGGSIIDRANLVAACNPCNEAVEDNPSEAKRRGWKRTRRPAEGPGAN